MNASKWIACSLAVVVFGGGLASAQTASKCDVPAWEAKLKATPGELSVMVELGKAYLCAGRFRDAQYALEDAVALDFKGFDAHFYLARALFEQGDADAALFEYGQLVSIFPERMEPLYQMGVVYARLRKTDESIKAFTSAIDVGKKAQVPPSVLIDTYLGLISQQRLKGDFAGAAKSYEEALVLKSDDASLQLGRAQMLFDSGKVNDALPLAYELVRKDAANAPAVMLIADIYEKQGLLDRAIREIDRSLESVKAGRERANLLTRRGLLLQKLGRKNDALAAFAAATNTYADAWEANYNLGVLKLNDKPAEALAHFKAAARVRPEDGQIQFNIAAAQLMLKNYSAAYSAAKASMALLPDAVNKAKARLLAGQAAYLAAQYQDALAELKQLVLSDPNNYQHQLWFGLTALALKDTTNATIGLENAVKLNPNAVEARTNLGAAYIAAKRFGEAVEVSKSVLTVEPANVEALTNYGIALANLGRIEEAKAALAKAAGLGSVAAKKALEALK